MPERTRRQLLADLIATVSCAPLVGVAAGGLVSACAPRRAARDALDRSDDALMVTVDAVRGAKAPFALRGRFSVRLDSPGASGTVQGAVILHQPDRFRVELLTPFGTPLLYVASNGSALHAWSQRDGVFYRGNDAARVLDQLTGGAVGLADVNAVLTGMLPLPDAPVEALSEDDEGMVRLTLQAPNDVQLRAVLDPKEELTRELLVVRTGQEPSLPLAAGIMPTGETMVEVRYDETRRVGRNRLPERVKVSLPTLGWTLDLDFQSWDELGQIPEVFELAPPNGALEQDLVETLRDLAEKQAAQNG